MRKYAIGFVLLAVVTYASLVAVGLHHFMELVNGIANN